MSNIDSMMAKCTRCDEEFYIDDFEYIGPVEIDDYSCSPFTPIIYLCKNCITLKEKQRIDSRARSGELYGI